MEDSMPYDFLKSGISNPEKFIDVYADNFGRTVDWIKDYQGVKHDFFYGDLSKQLNQIRFLLVFSDVLSLYPKGLDPIHGGKVKLIRPETLSTPFNITLPSVYLRDFAIVDGKPLIHPGFMAHMDNEIEKQVRLLESALVTNRIILHATRTINVLSKDSDILLDDSVNNPRKWLSYNVEPNSPIGEWLVKEHLKSVESVRVSFSPKEMQNSTECASIVVPYLQNISIARLEEILSDCNDEVVIFRKAIRQIVQEVKIKGQSLEEIIQDVIDPSISALNLKFKSIKNKHKRSLALSIGSMPLSLLSIFLGTSDIIGALGIGGAYANMSKSEIEYWNEQDKMKTDDFYLLWKFRNH